MQEWDGVRLHAIIEGKKSLRARVRKLTRSGKMERRSESVLGKLTWSRILERPHAARYGALTDSSARSIPWNPAKTS